MRLAVRALILLAAVAAVAGLGAAVLYFAVPAHESAEEGPADPLLHARRPVVRALRWLGVLDGASPGFDPWLPSGYSSEWMLPDTRDVVAARLTRKSVPVYRGLFWPVGNRITVTMEEFHGHEYAVRSMRLGYVREGRLFIASDQVLPGPSHGRSVTGFVPLDAEGWFAEEVDTNGTRHDLCSHGTDGMQRILDAR